MFRNLYVNLLRTHTEGQSVVNPNDYIDATDNHHVQATRSSPANNNSHSMSAAIPLPNHNNTITANNNNNMNMINNNVMEREYITLHSKDVLFGRGSGPNERVGNIEFRNIVLSRKEEYIATPARDHYNKSRIAHEVVEALRAGGGRFVKRAVGQHPGEPDRFILADQKTVIEKTKQALRQHPSVGRDKQLEIKRQKKREKIVKDWNNDMNNKPADEVTALKDPSLVPQTNQEQKMNVVNPGCEVYSSGLHQQTKKSKRDDAKKPGSISLEQQRKDQLVSLILSQQQQQQQQQMAPASQAATSNVNNKDRDHAMEMQKHYQELVAQQLGGNWQPNQQGNMDAQVVTSNNGQGIQMQNGHTNQQFVASQPEARVESSNYGRYHEQVMQMKKNHHELVAQEQIVRQQVALLQRAQQFGVNGGHPAPQDVNLATQLPNPNQKPNINLPDGWRCVWSKTQQRWYFFHEFMGSCWDITSVASAIQAAGRDTTSTSAMGVHAMNSSSLQETQAAHLLDQESIGTQNQQIREQFKKQLKQRHKSTSAAQGTSITSYEQKQIQQENAAIASTLLARGLSDDHTIGTISISGRSCGSTLETMALEKFLIDGQSSTQRSVASVGSRLSKAKRHCKNSIRGGDSGSDLIDGIEDMSLPSMSLGDVSEFGASTVMSKRRLSRGGGSKDSLGGGSKTIAEGSENSGSSHSEAFQEEAAKARDYISRQKSSAASISSSVEEVGSVESNNRMEAVAALTLMSVSSPQPSKASSVSSKETTNRSVSFVEDILGIRQAAAPQPVAVPVAAAPVVNMETEQAHVHESDRQLVDTSRKKKRKQKRQSLSSYYREVRASDNCEMDIDESGE